MVNDQDQDNQQETRRSMNTQSSNIMFKDKSFVCVQSELYKEGNC